MYIIFLLSFTHLLVSQAYLSITFLLLYFTSVSVVNTIIVCLGSCLWTTVLWPVETNIISAKISFVSTIYSLIIIAILYYKNVCYLDHNLLYFLSGVSVNMYTLLKFLVLYFDNNTIVQGNVFIECSMDFLLFIMITTIFTLCLPYYLFP